MKWLAVLIGLLVTVGAALEFPRDRVLRGQNDFLSFYCGARLSGTGQLRSVEAHRNIAEPEAGIWMPSVVFTRPDYYGILLRPLGWLPFRHAYWLFQTLSLMALITFFWLFRREPDLWMLALCSIPLVSLFANGQDVALVMLAFSGSILLLGKDTDEHHGLREFCAGLLLSLCTVKFHLFVFVPVALIAYRRWKMIGGACVGTAVGVIAATFVEGPGWMVRYAKFLNGPELYPMPMPLNFHAVARVLGWGRTGDWMLCLAVAVCLLWLAWRRIPFGTLISLCLLGGLLVSRFMGLHDYALLLAGCALSEGLVRKGFFCLATPPVYLLMLFPEPWSALGVAAVCTLFALPFVHWQSGTFLHAARVGGLKEAV
jgi:hypothetical protein